MIRKSETQDALVLSSSKFKDDSAIITLSGQNGIFSLYARGIYKPKSPLKPLLIVGNFVSVEYKVSQNGPGFASSLKVIEDASLLYQDYKSNCFLLLLQELSLSLFRYGDAFPQEEVMRLIFKLQDHGDSLSLALLLLGIFYKRFGLNIQTKECVVCHKSDYIVSYSLQEGGFLCQNCCNDLHKECFNEMDLYVLKFAFSPLTDDILNKKVPQESGVNVFLSLLENLILYFDLKPLRCLPLFLQAIQ